MPHLLRKLDEIDSKYGLKRVITRNRRISRYRPNRSRVCGNNAIIFGNKKKFAYYVGSVALDIQDPMQDQTIQHDTSLPPPAPPSITESQTLATSLGNLETLILLI